MSAIAAIFRRDRAPVSRHTLGALAGRLAHRGPDGRDLAVEGSMGVAHLHAWVTPEEVGERQPLRSDGRLLAFDGRIDNRGELIAALGIRPSERTLSDARLVLAAHAVWGDDFCGRLLGPFALALFEPGSRRGLLARDALGDRSLFYADLGKELVIASEEACLLDCPGVSAEFDESRLAHYFAAAVPDDGSTFFQGVTELAPGTLVRISEESIVSETWWSPPRPGGSRARPATDLADELHDLLSRAIECRLRSPSSPAVLMSGGLDSTSIAALGAESIARAGGGQRMGAISWVFDSIPALDERAYIHPVVERWGLEAREFAADRLAPQPDAHELCLNPSSPEENPYRRLKSRAYAEAADCGRTVLLSGGSADALYVGFEGWLAALIAERRPITAASELLADLWRSGLRTGLRRAGLGRWLKRLRRDRRGPAWLTPRARTLIEDRIRPAESASAARLRAATGPRAARGVSLEGFEAARAGIDLRHPYRDRRLVEFALALPAHELYRHGRFKPIARRALAKHLPPEVLARTEPTRLTPLLDEALRGGQKEHWRRVLEADGAIWPRFVRRDWLNAALDGPAAPAADVVLWNCLALELWRRRFGR